MMLSKAKKIMTAMLTTGIIGTAMLVPVQAAVTESASSNLTMFQPNDPVYTVTVPETIAIDTKEVTNVPITASDVAYIPEGKKISVTLTKGSGTYGRLYLEEVGKPDTEIRNNYLMTLDIKGTSGDYKSGALEKQIKGMELASFTEDGTMNFQMYPCAFDYPGSTGNLAIQKGIHYAGSMVYGVALVDDTAAK